MAGEKFPHRNDGSVFKNRPLPGEKVPELPVKPEGYYREFVHSTAGIDGPGAQRVVIGRGGEIYYTPDHYKTFVEVK
jgi:guanyl-specific ribonuclease Sa